MEKRIFIAFLFSFLFLTVWAKITPAPNGKRPQNNVAVVTPVPLADGVMANPRRETAAEERKPTAAAKIHSLENSKLRVDFSNIGGTIEKITIKDFGETLPITKVFDVSALAQEEFSVENLSEDKIVYVKESEGNRVKKTYELSQNDFLIFAQIEMSKEQKINMYTLDISRMDKTDDRDKSLFEYSLAFSEKIFRKSNAFKFENKELKNEKKVVNWFGFRDRYFSFIIKPDYQMEGYESYLSNEKSIRFLTVPRETAGYSSNQFYKAVIYAGPQQKEVLEKYNFGFEKMVAYSDWAILDVPAHWVYSMLIFLHKIIPNWGLAIIVLGILIYLITYPLTLAGLSSMRRMQSIQPQMTELREKYKNNPQKLNQEMMALYKVHKVNPMGGCLPMLIQMPIFVALYQVLWRSVVLKGQGFLWIRDLSMPDRIFVLKQNLPLIGNEINILPFLMAFVMALQQKFSSKAMNITDETQLQQQKMMLWMLPIMMLFIFYKAASGLTLYFTVLYMMTAFTQWKMSKVTG